MPLIHVKMIESVFDEVTSGHGCIADTTIATAEVTALPAGLTVGRHLR
jgi:hypothetical protein